MNSPENVSFIFVVVVIVVFFILRSFWCWYWKINRRIALLESIEEKLSKLTDTQSHDYH